MIKPEGFSFDLGGRTVLVTGASSGLGARFAQILAASGANVVLAARRGDRLAELRDTIVRGGGRAIAVSMDVSDEASTIAAYDAAEAAFGRVTSVIANAGVNAEGPATELAIDEFDQLMAVNLRGVFLTAREGAKRMMASGSREQEDGRIVIISSITAQAVSPGLAAYSASKAAVLQMGRVLARDWARQGIGVNMICPGYIPTEINSDWFETEAGARYIAKWPRKRLMRDSDLDAMLLYLASDASRSVTGSVFTVDDGQSL
ncbi:MAG: SDR family NAD(P)-dependent oxidoreductase [Sphingomonadaceae bacterium]